VIGDDDVKHDLVIGVQRRCDRTLARGRRGRWECGLWPQSHPDCSGRHRENTHECGHEILASAFHGFFLFQE
jgi:hypothetical protein